MKNKLTLLLLLFSLVAAPLYAQSDTDKPVYNKLGKRSELRIGYGGSPIYYSALIQNKVFGRNLLKSLFQSNNFDLDDAYGDRSGNIISCGSFNLEYSYFFFNWLALSVDVGATPMWGTRLNAFGDKVRDCNGLFMHILPKVRFSYLRKNIVSLYSDVGMGCAFGWYDNKTVSSFLFHATPVGVTVGNRVYGFAECNLSMKTIGCTIGAGFRF